jgi:hypothetical protein
VALNAGCGKKDRLQKDHVAAVVAKGSAVTTLVTCK